MATSKSYRLRGSHEEIWSLAFSPDDKTLATCSDNAVQLWNLATKEQVTRLNGHSSKVASVTFSRDGKMLVSGSFDKTIKLWRAATEAEVNAADLMEGIEPPRSSIRHIAPFGI